MKLTSVILAVAASGALAMPGTPDETQTSRRSVTQPWAGAVDEDRGWNFVTGTITVPNISGQNPSSAVAIWVGIDGLSCQNAILQTGLTFYGDGTIDNWFEWWPIQPQRYSQRFSARPGDKVRMTVNAWSYNSGNSTLENLTTGEKTVQEFRNMRYNLCLTDAEWIWEDFGQVQLANFGTVDFVDTHARGQGGAADPSRARIVNIVADGRQKTQCGSNANGVRCQYTG